MAIKFKNSVTVAGTVEDFDLEVRSYPDKKTGENYDAMVGTITLRIGDGEDAQFPTMRVFKRDFNKDGSANRDFKTYEKWLTQDREDVIGTPVSIGTAFSPNAYIAPSGDLVKSVQIQAGFVNTSRVGTPRSEFRTDVLLTQPPVEETNAEGEATGRYKLSAEVFDFRNMAFPVTFILELEQAVDYFESLGIDTDNPVLLEVWGDAVNSQITQKREVESAFGDPKIETRTITRRENIITGASTEEKEITEEIFGVITEGKQAYNVYIDSVETKAKENDNAFNKKDKKSESGSETKPKKKGFSF